MQVIEIISVGIGNQYESIDSENFENRTSIMKKDRKKILNNL